MSRARLRIGEQRVAPDSVTIDVRVIPRARRTECAGRRGGAWLIRLAAPPVDGAANTALVAFLSGVLDRPSRDIAIVAGHTSRDKRLRIAGITIDEIERRISARDG